MPVGGAVPADAAVTVVAAAVAGKANQASRRKQLRAKTM